MISALEVDRYIDGAPEALRADLEWLRTQIRAALPFADESLQSKMPVYTAAGQWVAGFAWRAKGPMLYIMNREILDARSAQLGKHRSGHTCIEFRPSKSLDKAELQQLAIEMLAELAQRTSAHVPAPQPAASRQQA